MNKKVNLLYFSATNNTSLVLKSIGSKLTDTINDYNITLVENRVDNIIFNEDDLVIVGVPVYAGRIPRFLTEFFNKVKGNNTLAVFVVTYGNRDYEDALLELKDLFESNGFIGLAGAVFVGEHSYSSLLANNRPNEDDLKIAESFGEKIKNKLNSLNNINDIGKLQVPGNYPYVVKELVMPNMSPETDDVCLQCKICYKHCPTQAIDPNNCKKVDENKCIKCCSCIRKCPLNAKKFTHPLFKNMENMLINNFSTTNNSPEIYL